MLFSSALPFSFISKVNETGVASVLLSSGLPGFFLVTPSVHLICICSMDETATSELVKRKGTPQPEQESNRDLSKFEARYPAAERSHAQRSTRQTCPPLQTFPLCAPSTPLPGAWSKRPAKTQARAWNGGRRRKAAVTSDERALPSASQRSTPCKPARWRRLERAV